MTTLSSVRESLITIAGDLTSLANTVRDVVLEVEMIANVEALGGAEEASVNAEAEREQEASVNAEAEREPEAEGSPEGVDGPTEAEREAAGKGEEEAPTEVDMGDDMGDDSGGNGGDDKLVEEAEVLPAPDVLPELVSGSDVEVEVKIEPVVETAKTPKPPVTLSGIQMNRLKAAAKGIVQVGPLEQPTFLATTAKTAKKSRAAVPKEPAPTVQINFVSRDLSN